MWLAGPKLGVGSPALCVALLKWVIFHTEKGERYSPVFIVSDREARWPDAALGLGLRAPRRFCQVLLGSLRVPCTDPTL